MNACFLNFPIILGNVTDLVICYLESMISMKFFSLNDGD